LQPVAETLILTARSSGSTVDIAALYTREIKGLRQEISVKNKLMLAGVLVALSLPMWAEPKGGWYIPPPPPPPHRNTAVPEGGNWPAYMIVSGAALLGGLMLSRKRETGTVADRS
jgi:hypothetical protein